MVQFYCHDFDQNGPNSYITTICGLIKKQYLPEDNVPSKASKAKAHESAPKNQIPFNGKLTLLEIKVLEINAI